jgi:hypothetical protein
MSYITNPPTDGVVGRAGGKWTNPSAYCPPRETIVVQDDLIGQIPKVAWFMQNYHEVQVKRSACISFQEVQEKGL